MPKEKIFYQIFSGQVHQEFLDQKKIPLVGGVFITFNLYGI